MLPVVELSVTERTAYILKVRQLAVGIAKTYVAEGARESLPAEASR